MGFTDWIGDHSDGILLVFGMVGSAAAGLLFAKGGAKAHKDLEIARENNHGKDISQKEKVVIVAKNLAVPAAVEALSLMSIGGATRIKTTKANIAIASANTSAALASQALADYRSEVKRSLGENQDRKIQDGVAQNKVDEDFQSNEGQTPTPVNAPQIGDVLCKDAITGRYFWSTPEKLHHAENMLVHDMASNYSATLNDWYGRLAIEGVNDGVGEYLEWTNDDDFSLDISTTKTHDERPCLYVGYYPYPHGPKRMFGDLD